MGSKTSHPHQRRNNEPSSNGHQQTQRTTPPPPPPPPPPQLPTMLLPTVTTLPAPDHSPSVFPISQTPDRIPNNVLSISTPEQVTAPPYSPNAILASPIPEIYFSNDMIHIDSPEPAVSMDPSIPSYVSATGEISQAYPEPDPYITNYVELYGIPPAPPLNDANGIRDPNFRDSFVTINGIRLAQPRKKNWDIPTRDEYIYSFSYQSNNWF